MDRRDEVAEAVDVHDGAGDRCPPPRAPRARPAAPGRRIGGPSRAASTPTRQMRGRRSEHVAAVERAAHDRQPVVGRLGSSKARQLSPRQERREQAVVGTDEAAAAGRRRPVPRRAVPTPGSTTARWTVPAGKNGAAASSASAPSVMSWRSTSWVTSTSCRDWRAAWAMPSMTPFISATYASRSPKSVVSVTIPATRVGGASRRSPIAIHDEVRDQRQRLALLGRRERLEIGLGRLGEGVRAGARVLRRRRAPARAGGCPRSRRPRASGAAAAPARARPPAGGTRSSIAMSGSVRLPSRRSAPIALPSRSWSASKSSASSEIWKAIADVEPVAGRAPRSARAAAHRAARRSGSTPT